MIATVTIKDIAKRGGVSHVAVSNVLRGTGRIGKDTRQRILKLADDMGYRPNAGALAFRSGRHGAIGLLLSAESNRSYLPHQLLIGIESTIARQGQRLILARLADAELSKQGFVPALLKQWSADGLLINYQEGIPPEMQALIDKDRNPAVWINSKDHDHCVYADDFQGGKIATEHLLQLGHKRIGYLDYSHPESEINLVHYSARDRRSGYEAAMKAAGLSPRPYLTDSRIKESTHLRIAHARTILAQSDRPTAFVTYSATSAGPLGIAALTLGLNVPDDLSIVSNDDNTSAPFGPALTTAIVPQQAIGEIAAGMLQEIIDQQAPSAAVHATVPPVPEVQPVPEVPPAATATSVPFSLEIRQSACPPLLS
jgi:LacI family transcriptional regulator